MYNLITSGLFLLITIGRLTSIAIGVLGLGSLVIGSQALTRLSRIKGLAALIIGLTVVLLGLLHVSLSTGGFGTGSGKLGAIVAMLIGLTGAVLGGLALMRLRRMVK